MPVLTFTPYWNRNRDQTSGLTPVFWRTFKFGVTAGSLSSAAAACNSVGQVLASLDGMPLPMKMM